jgi:hypothetical protein
MCVSWRSPFPARRLPCSMRCQLRLVRCNFGEEPQLIPAGTGVTRFFEQHTWAQSALQLQQHLHEAVQQSSEPLKPQPTVYSAEGMLSIMSPSADTTVISHAGEHTVRYELAHQSLLQSMSVTMPVPAAANLLSHSLLGLVRMQLQEPVSNSAPQQWHHSDQDLCVCQHGAGVSGCLSVRCMTGEWLPN